MSPCSQCERPAVFQAPGGQLLCVEHWHMIEEVNLRQEEMAMQRVLLAEVTMAAAVNDPGMMSRALAQMEALGRASNATTNTVNVSNSVIGAVTTGSAVRNLNVKIGTLSHTPGTEEVVKALSELRDTIVQSKTLTEEQQKEAVEGLDYLAEQAARSPEERQGGVIRTVLATLQTTLSVSGDLITVWGQWGATLLTFFCMTR